MSLENSLVANTIYEYKLRQICLTPAIVGVRVHKLDLLPDLIKTSQTTDNFDLHMV